MKIYALGGLGADKRTFNYLKLENHELICLDWKTPLKKETLSDYAARYQADIDENGEIGLLGVSFGGMIMVELAKIIEPKHTFLISSVSKSDELRWSYRAAGKLKLDYLVPYSLMVRSGRLIHYLFGVNLMRDKKLLSEILDDMDPKFIKWAIRAIVSWKSNPEVRVIRFHGTRDRVLPLRRQNADHSFSKCGHFIIVNQAEKISEILDTY